MDAVDRFEMAQEHLRLVAETQETWSQVDVLKVAHDWSIPHDPVDWAWMVGRLREWVGA